jgi:membrane fusion protein (multidrug efflux system)
MSENKKEKSTGKRNKIIVRFIVLVFLIGIGSGIYWFVYGSKFVSTDNAYTAVEIAQVTSSVGGIVKEVSVKNTQKVHKGDILLKLDPIDAQNKVDEAQANLDSTVRRIKGYIKNAGHLKEKIIAQEANKKRIQAQLIAAESSFQKALIDLKRRQALIASGAVSADEITKVKNTFIGAKARLNELRATQEGINANLESAKYEKEINTALIQGTTYENHPEVLAAKAKLRQAKIDLDRTVIKSPVNGVISKRQVQLGQHVQVGTYLLSVVPVSKVHVDANFKEGKLTKVKLGQKVTLYSDLYGKKVIYHGIVDGFSGGTGAAFATIPAQNATGNWIKVVQRVPVRIKLDSKELKKHPLMVGLSMNAKIDVQSQE